MAVGFSSCSAASREHVPAWISLGMTGADGLAIVRSTEWSLSKRTHLARHSPSLATLPAAFSRVPPPNGTDPVVLRPELLWCPSKRLATCIVTLLLLRPWSSSLRTYCLLWLELQPCFVSSPASYQMRSMSPHHFILRRDLSSPSPARHCLVCFRAGLSTTILVPSASAYLYLSIGPTGFVSYRPCLVPKFPPVCWQRPSGNVGRLRPEPPTSPVL